MHSLNKIAFALFAFSLCLLPQPSTALEVEEEFDVASIVSSAELDSMRGAFINVGAVMVDFSFMSRVSIDNVLQVQRSLRASDLNIAQLRQFAHETGQAWRTNQQAGQATPSQVQVGGQVIGQLSQIAAPPAQLPGQTAQAVLPVNPAVPPILPVDPASQTSIPINPGVQPDASQATPSAAAELQAMQAAQQLEQLRNLFEPVIVQNNEAGRTIAIDNSIAINASHMAVIHDQARLRSMDVQNIQSLR